MYGELGTKIRIMKNLDKDPDFLDLLAAWHENKNVSPSRRAELIQRLEKDERLRIELAREIEMAGLTRAVQAGEPRWLELEEKLGMSSEQGSPDFESSIMNRDSKSATPKAEPMSSRPCIGT